MTKREMAEIIAASPAWDGARADRLVSICTKQELREILWMLDEAEDEERAG